MASTSSSPSGGKHLLVLEISCGRNVNEEVHVNLGDTAEEVAKAFIEKHRLKPKTMGKVSEHINNCLEQYLAEHPKERVLHEAALAERKGVGSFTKSIGSDTMRQSERSTTTSRDSSNTIGSARDSNSTATDASQRYNQLKSTWGAEPKSQVKNGGSNNGGFQTLSNHPDFQPSSARRADNSAKATAKTPNTLLSDKSKLKRELHFGGGASETHSVTTDTSTHTSTGTSVSDRLYKNSFASRKKRDDMKRRAEAMRQDEMKKGQYRVRGESRHIVEQMNYGTSKGNNGKPNILSRLYKDGLKDLEKRKQAELKAKRDREEEEDNRNWSCARCGVFHALPPGWTRDRSTGSLSPRRGSLEAKKDKPALKCPNCGFEQLGGQRYSVPHLHVHANIVQTVGSNGNAEDSRAVVLSQGDAARREIEKRMMHERKVAQQFDAQRNYEHSPHLMSEGSKKIMQKYSSSRTVTLDVSHLDDDLSASASASASAENGGDSGSVGACGGGGASVASSAHSTSAAGVDPSHPTAKYFSKPAHERLADLAKGGKDGNKAKVIPKEDGLTSTGFGGTATTGSSREGVVPVSVGITSRGDIVEGDAAVAALSSSSGSGSGKGESKSGGAGNYTQAFARSTATATATAAGTGKSKKQMDAFVDRLVYEHRANQQKRLRQLEEKYTRDPVTGQKFFTPCLPNPEAVAPGGIRGTGVTTITTTTTATTVHGDGESAPPPPPPRFASAKRDYRDFEKRKARLEEEADKAALKTLHAFRTMSSSDAIVKRAEARTADTAFCLYLDFVRAINGEAEAGDYVAHIPEEGWKDMSLDLEQVQTGLLLPELAKLLLALRFELIRGDNEVDLEYNESTSMVVSYSLFCFLVRQQATRVRDSRAGHSFIIPESKLLEQRQVNDLLCRGVPSEVLQEAIRSDKSFRLETEAERLARENSHKPRITRKAQAQAGAVASRMRRGAPVEEILLRQGKRAAENLEEARRRIANVESRMYTFNPRFYKPPPELAHITKRIDDSPVDGSGAAYNKDKDGQGQGQGQGQGMQPPRPKVIPRGATTQRAEQTRPPHAGAVPASSSSSSSLSSEPTDHIPSPTPAPAPVATKAGTGEEKTGDHPRGGEGTGGNNAIKNKEYSHGLVVSSPRLPPPLPAEVPVSSADKAKQQDVARRLAKELFGSSPRDPLK